MERKVRELEDSLKREQQASLRLQAEREVLLEKVGGKLKYGSRENSSSEKIVLINDDSLRSNKRSASRSPNRKAKAGGVLDEPLLGPGLVSTYGGVNSNAGTPQRRHSLASSEMDGEEEGNCCCTIC